ncbi:MAG: hypothetical protein IJ646_09010 [Clostridia bacterium]|nr:hypothetical protein [Clostridia bacterium]
MKMNRRILALVIACFLGLTALAESYTVYVNKDDAKVYDISGEVIGRLSVNTKLKLTGMKGDICRVEKGGNTAYMMKGDLSKKEICLENCDDAEKVETISETVYVGKDGAKVYDSKGKKLGTLAVNTKLTLTGVKDDICRVKKDGKTAYMRKSDLSDDRVEVRTAEIGASSGSSASSVKVMDWFSSDIQKIFSKGTTATITDVETGLSWREQRRGGSSHADVQPVSAEDTATLKKVYGGKWSWDRRAIIVTIDGVHYAASMNGMPHGSGAISSNNFDGHHCIHFLNSRTHGTDRVCPLHQAAIQKAAKAKI